MSERTADEEAWTLRVDGRRIVEVSQLNGGVHLAVEDEEGDIEVYPTPEQARDIARWLIEAADEAEHAARDIAAWKASGKPGSSYVPWWMREGGE